MKNKILGIIIALLMMLPVSLSAAEGDTFYYNGLYYTITNYSSHYVEVSNENNYQGRQPAKGDIVIPEKVIYSEFTSDVEFTVTAIGQKAFFDCNGLTSITIPNSVTTIGNDAFYCCYGLTSITIPNSVTTIGKSAFSDCSSLTSITIPNSVTTIGEGSFSGCSSLKSINVDADNQVYSSKDGVLYNKEQTSLIKCPGGKLGEMIIPNSVTTIGKYAFSWCGNLTSITIPNSVMTIEAGTFSGCSRLTSITIPNSVTTIGYGAFSSCYSLTSITIPNSVTTIEERAFWGCRSLTSVTSFAVTPPECGKDAFYQVDKEICPLYVPAKSIQAYKQSTEWKEFAIIEEVDESGIGAIEVGAEGAAEVYNLMGVKVADSLDNLPTGIYIVNGRKVAVK